MNEEQKCLICGQKMRLEMYDSASYYQCSADPTHRMSLTEFSDLVHEKRSEEEIGVTMKKRARELRKQLDKESLEQ